MSFITTTTATKLLTAAMGFKRAGSTRDEQAGLGKLF